MSWTVIAILIIVGLLFLVLEILVIPGTTVVGVIGFLLIGIGIWQTYAVHGTTAGHLVLFSSVVLTVITLAIALRSKTWKKVMLDTAIDSKVNVNDPNLVKPGDKGKSVSRLAPMGKALINDQYFEVTTMGEYVEPGTDLVVIRVEGTKIYVKTINT